MQKINDFDNYLIFQQKSQCQVRTSELVVFYCKSSAGGGLGLVAGTVHPEFHLNNTIEILEENHEKNRGYYKAI